MTELTEVQQVEKEKMQLSLFSMLDGTNSDSSAEYSNSIGSIDIIPRFWRGNAAAFSKSELGSRDLIYNNSYTFEGKEFRCQITPAVIKRGDEEFFAYPGSKEELIEKVLFVLVARNGLSKKNIGNTPRYGVFFSLYQIREELKRIKKTRSYDSIRESLQILKDSRVKIISPESDGKTYTLTHDIFSDAVLESSGAGRNRDRYWIGFSDFVITEIMRLKYKQVVYSRITSYNGCLSRFLDLYLSNIWKNANFGIKSKISLNQVMESYGKSHTHLNTKRRDMRSALLDLVESKVIVAAPFAQKMGSGDSIDYIYEIEPTREFVDQMIQSNAKHKGLRTLTEKVNNGEDIQWLGDNQHILKT